MSHEHQGDKESHLTDLDLKKSTSDARITNYVSHWWLIGHDLPREMIPGITGSLNCTHYNTLQHTITHCNNLPLQQTATDCNRLQHTAIKSPPRSFQTTQSDTRFLTLIYFTLLTDTMQRWSDFISLYVLRQCKATDNYCFYFSLYSRLTACVSACVGGHHCPHNSHIYIMHVHITHIYICMYIYIPGWWQVWVHGWVDRSVMPSFVSRYVGGWVGGLVGGWMVDEWWRRGWVGLWVGGWVGECAWSVVCVFPICMC